MSEPSNAWVSRLRRQLIELLSEQLTAHQAQSVDPRAEPSLKSESFHILSHLYERYGRSRIVSLTSRNDTVFTFDELLTIAHALGYRPQLIY